MAGVSAQAYWSVLGLEARSAYVRRAAQVVLDVAGELVGFLGREHGRGPDQAWALELLPGVDALHWAAGAAPHALAPRRVRAHTPLARGRRARLVRAPVGTVGVVPSPRAPWAWPLEHAGVALMAGNGVVLRASPAAERIVRVWERAGVPEGLVVLGSEEDLARADVVRDDGAAHRDAPGPMLVLRDAGLERAARAAAWAADPGVPAGVAQVLVARDVADAFARALARVGGEGVPIEPVVDTEEALTRAAAGPPAGGASVWSDDRAQALRVAGALTAHVVWINDHANPAGPRSPEAFTAVTRPALHVGAGPAPWWPPRDAALARALATTAALLYGRESDRAGALRDGIRPLLRVAGRSLRR